MSKRIQYLEVTHRWSTLPCITSIVHLTLIRRQVGKKKRSRWETTLKALGKTIPCSREILGRRDFGFSICLLRGVNILSSAQCCEPRKSVHKLFEKSYKVIVNSGTLQSISFRKCFDHRPNILEHLVESIVALEGCLLDGELRSSNALAISAFLLFLSLPFLISVALGWHWFGPPLDIVWDRIGGKKDWHLAMANRGRRYFRDCAVRSIDGAHRFRF